MMECKKALTEAGGDMGKAEEILRIKLGNKATKAAARITAEGLVAVSVADHGKLGAIVEVNCETDFVAKNDEFKALGESICKAAIKKGYTSVNDELSGMLSNLATKIRENMTLKRVLVLDIPAGAAAAKYVHTSDWKTGVIVIVGADPAGAADNPLVKEFVYDCCLHIAAFTPLYNTRADVDAAYIAEQKDIFTKQTASLDKPDKVKEGIVQGKVNKHLAEICFMDQTFVKDEKVTVAKKMEEVGKSVGAKLTLLKTVRMRLGE